MENAVKTKRVSKSWTWFYKQPLFRAGWEDMMAGRGFRKEYDDPKAMEMDVNSEPVREGQMMYEFGRAMANCYCLGTGSRVLEAPRGLKGDYGKQARREFFRFGGSQVFYWHSWAVTG